MRKEFAVYCLAHALMLTAANRQGVGPDRISFVDAVRWPLSTTPGEDLRDLIVSLARPGRHEPRVTKDPYPKIRRPRHELRTDLKQRAKAT